MSEPRYIVGIDLGTTNTAVAFVDRQKLHASDHAEVELFEIEQLEKPGSVLAKKSLPSFVYLAGKGELPEGSMDLPWATNRDYMVGLAARERGAEVPLRLISSSKSWLCHGGVDRRAAILPYQAPAEVEKLSPIAATRRLLEHLRHAWNHRHPETPLESQTILLTVPASFDAAAKDLTLEAATAAGLPQVRLLEEPQAAFYAWLAEVQDGWREQLRPGDRVLVCDVGGGTTDFSLIEVREDSGRLELERVAVGDHILLGGDNMDLALAHHLHEKLRAADKKLDAGQQRALVQAARTTKEKLLGDASLASAPITLLGRGSKLIGNKIQTELVREDVERILVEGFFPVCAKDAVPATQRRTGFMELGLPFAVEAGITKHLAAFIRSDERAPTHLLFNGGVFNSPVLRARLLEVLGAWSDRVPKVLDEPDLDLAVARGAAYLGATKEGKGIRIRSASARAYYVGIETAAPSVPGVPPPVRALCVVPMGMEEGSTADVPGAELGLVVGEPVSFRFFTSTTRKEDSVGAVLDEYTWPDVLEETAPLQASLPAENLAPGTIVPVRLEVHVTELGTVEIWSVRSDDAPGRWRLEFNVREERA